MKGDGRRLGNFFPKAVLSLHSEVGDFRSPIHRYNDMLLMAVKLLSSFLTLAPAYHSLTSRSTELHELTTQDIRCVVFFFFLFCSFNLH